LNRFGHLGNVVPVGERREKSRRSRRNRGKGSVPAGFFRRVHRGVNRIEAQLRKENVYAAFQFFRDTPRKRPAIPSEDEISRLARNDGVQIDEPQPRPRGASPPRHLSQRKPPQSFAMETSRLDVRRKNRESRVVQAFSRASPVRAVVSRAFRMTALPIQAIVAADSKSRAFAGRG